MSINEGINLLEQSLHIKLSPEQKKIIKYNIRTPILVDACAGSGKTMLFLFSALQLIITGQVKPQEILGVTFSKRAQLDMQKRYNHDVQALQRNNVNLNSNLIPYFTTFHALFYRILRMSGKFKNAQVIPSYQMISFHLGKILPYPSKLETKAEMLKHLFNFRGQMINHGLTYDGINLLKHPKHSPSERAKLLLHVIQPQGESEKKLCANYHTVVNAYNTFKQKRGYIDFTDMMVKLLELLLSSKKYLAIARNIMKRFKVVFIDEFQDINDAQWELMRLILSKVALDHLVVIGDDDQSIYSFRGSNPDIILEYHHNYPQSRTFNLSTNYRTGGNILQVVKPLITTNHYRLPKHLLTGRPQQGKFVEYFSNNRKYSANTMLLEHLWKQINDSSIDNDDIAVLVHYNNSRMFVIDWLATHHYYVNTTSSNYVLQNNYIYKILTQIAHSLFFDQLQGILKYATRIGFRQFKAHIYRILQVYHKNANITLSEYCNLAHQYEGKLNSKQINVGNYAKDDSLYHYVKIIQHPNAKEQNQIGDILWIAVDDLTHTYFKYMLEKKYMNKEMVHSINNYLGQEFSKLKTRSDVIEFFGNEQLKLYHLKHHRNSRHQPSIHIMSLHQSKGLQFKYVYLYGINSRRDSAGEVYLNHYFKPNMKIQNFVRFLLLSSGRKINIIGDRIYGKDSKEKEDFTLLFRKINHYVEDNFLSPESAINQITERKFTETMSQVDIQKQIWQAYNDLIHSSKFIEEQRRLIYVGITRAQSYLYLAYAKDADPLLNELQVPNGDKYYLEANDQIMGVKQDHLYQRKLLLAKHHR